MAVVRLLIDGHAPLDQTTDTGCTALYIAASKGHETAVSLLLAAGASHM